MNTRRRADHEKTFSERLAEEAIRLKDAADSLPAGNPARDLLLQRIRKTETPLDVDAWLRSPGKRHPE
jgi:hypothetical protein